CLMRMGHLTLVVSTGPVRAGHVSTYEIKQRSNFLMKTKFTNHEIFHVWAAQRQQSGRGNSTFFEGPVAYSYGKHYPLAKIYSSAEIPSPEGEQAPPVVLVNSTPTSVPTQKHLRHLKRAITHLERYDV